MKHGSLNLIKVVFISMKELSINVYYHLNTAPIITYYNAKLTRILMSSNKYVLDHMLKDGY